jgi:hypothetical protein
MDYQVKLFCWQNNGTCLIIVARGPMDSKAFLRIFREIVEVTKPLDDCKVLLDLQDATCDFGFDDLVELEVELRIYPSPAVSKLKLAMVTTRHPEEYGRLRLLMLPVSQLGIDVVVFYEATRAIDWLADETNHRFS